MTPILQSATNEFLADPSPTELDGFRKALAEEIADQGEIIVTIGGGDEVGLVHEEMEQACCVLTKVAHGLNCDVSIVRRKEIEKSDFEVGEFMVRRQLANENKFT